MNLYKAGFGAILLASLMSAEPVTAQLQVRPIPAELPAGSQASRVVVRNTSDQPMAVQARVFRWEQINGEELLTTTPAIALSPTVARIPPGEEQIIRVLRLDEAGADLDRQFRIVLDELPEQTGQTGGGALSVRLQMVLPLFDRAESAKEAALECALSSDLASVSCLNQGGQAARLTQSVLKDADSGQAIPLSDGLLGYVLPGSIMSWPLNTPAPENGRWILDTGVNDQHVEVVLGLQQ